MVDGDRDRETEHTTIIERDGGGGGGGMLAIVLLIIVLLVLVWVFRNEIGLTGGDTEIEVPEQIDVTVTNT